jgi:hemerythrin-like domain-containing protein
MDAAPRRALILGAASGALLAASACSKPPPHGEDLAPTEDLMREHGVLRRILIVYREAATYVRSNFSGVDARPISRAADLFRRFGEAYHEQLEETHVFPQALAAGLVPTLIAQHARGREITAYIRAKTASGAVAGTDAAPLAQALETFARMYEPHAAFEDTVVFQTWRKRLSKQALAEAGDRFEDAEKAALGPNGFEAAVSEIESIEAALRLNELARYTAASPGLADPGVLPAPPDTTAGAD